MQQADAAIVAFATHDADEANAVCLLLGKAGWPTMRRRFTGSPDDATLAAEVADAQCLIILWSSSAAALQRLQFATERAHRSGAMIALRLDDSVFPIDAATPLNFTGWPHQADLATCESLLNAVAARLGPPPLRGLRMQHRQRPSEDPRVTGQPNGARPIPAARALRAVRARRQGGFHLGIVGGAAAIGLIALGAGTLDPNGVGAPISTAWTATETFIEDALTGAPHTLPSAGLATTEPQRLRGFLETHGTGVQSRAAEQATADIEAKDWLQVRAVNDAEHALAALAKFRATYPEGRNALAAANLEADWRALIEEAEAQLERLGYPIVRSDGLLHPQTRASVRAFQSAQGMPPDGKIDRALLFALQGARSDPLALQDAVRP